MSVPNNLRQIVQRFMLLAYLLMLSNCNEEVNKGKRRDNESLEEISGNGKHLISKDVVFSEWFTYQSFAINIITTENGEKILNRSNFSKFETPAEDVIEIQRKSIRELLNYRGDVDKYKKFSQWVETQLKAEEVLVEFVLQEPSLVEPNLKELIETDEYYTDLLSRQKNLLEIVRRQRSK